MDISYIREALDYCPHSGLFYWKERPRNHFDSDRAWWQWNGRYKKKLAGTISKPNNKFGYKRIKIIINKKPFFAHQLAWQLMNGDIPDGLFVDHINGDATFNAIKNLRLVTHSENHRNRKFPSNNASGAVGVRQCGESWQARIKVQGKEIYLGSFKTFKEAADAREKASIEFGFTRRHYSK